MMPSDPHHNIFVVTGKVHSGKTTFVSNLVERLREKQLSISGFLSKGTFANGQREKFSLIDLKCGVQLPLATIYPEEGWTRFRKFYFNPFALKKGEELIREGLRTNPDLIVIDEVGPMELQGQGWSGILESLAEDYQVSQLWIVRNQILPEVLDRWNIPVENVYLAEKNQADRLRDRLLDNC
ncbi:MAG: DUF2478 domain-containing protein [Bacteroidales bacterium]|nr:DUF2478 domain-containing protein [Bacteroidales bacterium]